MGKVHQEKNKTSRLITHEGSSSGLSRKPPAIFTTSSTIQRSEDDSACFAPDPNDTLSRENQRFANEQAELRRRLTPQTMMQLLTSTRDDTTGQYDPFTRIIKAIYSPADEAENVGKTIENLPGLKEKIERALTEQTDEAYWEAANEMYEASKDIPDVSPLPTTKIPKKPLDYFSRLKEYGTYLKRLVEGGEVDAPTSVCTPEEQARTQVGKVIYWSFLEDRVDFMSRKGQTMRVKYIDVPRSAWTKIDGVDYILFDSLPLLEAKASME